MPMPGQTPGRSSREDISVLCSYGGNLWWRWVWWHRRRIRKG